MKQLTIRQRHGIQSIFALMDGSCTDYMSRREWALSASQQLKAPYGAVMAYIRRLDQTKMFRDWMARCNIARVNTPLGVYYWLKGGRGIPVSFNLNDTRYSTQTVAVKLNNTGYVPDFGSRVKFSDVVEKFGYDMKVAI